jgi:UDP-N-acetylmuramoyl-tripeptide--D-alanyl-D-alanine ligase
MNAFLKKIVYRILTAEARLVLWRHRPRIIAITGSVGKTSTKEAAWTLLREHYEVRKSPRSYNSQIGVPLTILGIHSAWNSPVGWFRNILQGAVRVLSWAPYPELLVLEMGVDRPGDFDEVLTWIRPDVAVVTAIGDVPVHVEFFGDAASVAKEKSKLVQAVPQDGVVILNADDPLVLKMRNNTRAEVLAYGFDKTPHVRGNSFKMITKKNKPDGIAFKIDFDGKSMPIRVEGVFGIQNAYALLAAASIGLAEGLNLIEIAEGLAKYRATPGRLHVIEGIKDSTIIDDTYNSSPMAVRAALDTLESLSGKRKIAVLGDMLELGKYTVEEHRKIGVLATRVADVVIGVGVRAKFMVEEPSKKFHWFSSSQEAATYLFAELKDEDVVLVKGSQGMRMERVVEALMAHPEDASKLLVRQDKYWKDR